MSDENQQYETPRQILLLQQMMFVVRDVVDSIEDFFEPKYFISSFASDPTDNELRTNFGNGAGFLDQSHQLARECAQNCFWGWHRCYVWLCILIQIFSVSNNCFGVP